MKLAIVAYPDFDEADGQWIEAMRQLHDPQAARIAAHFTLVFPVDMVVSNLDPELEALTRSTRPIRFVIQSATAVRDAISSATHVFLVPDGEGSGEIAALHHGLYAGQLRAHLRGDIPYVPHMTVGAAQDSAAAERIASELAMRARTIRGRISRLDVVDVADARVRTVASWQLGDAANTSGL